MSRMLLLMTGLVALAAMPAGVALNAQSDSQGATMKPFG